ncbi:GNAT family N-acetyltransferase [Neobacillus sp. D3-1R]|uniref:GNAT family N-acetyltransferase n=1 Tax=Neobacillus sp. D3-1R TaxID=3445778 RepID=UPI003F9FCD4D
MIIRNANIHDLDDIFMIEQTCFAKDEAATKEALEKRILRIPDSFFVAEEEGTIIGFVNGPVIKDAYITDDLFVEIEPNPSSGDHQSILGIAVSPLFQKKGIASALLNHLEREATSKKRKTITLTCKEGLIPYYEKHNYVNKGISTSILGGVVWYDMVKELPNS